MVSLSRMPLTEHRIS